MNTETTTTPAAPDDVNAKPNAGSRPDGTTSATPAAPATPMSIFDAYKHWPEDIRRKLSEDDVRRMAAVTPCLVAAPELTLDNLFERFDAEDVVEALTLHAKTSWDFQSWARRELGLDSDDDPREEAEHERRAAAERAFIAFRSGNIDTVREYLCEAANRIM